MPKSVSYTHLDDKLEVQQAYDFSLTSWYLQKTISPDETVEIRLTLNRSGNYEEARYQIGYIPVSYTHLIPERTCMYPTCVPNRKMNNSRYLICMAKTSVTGNHSIKIRTVCC